MDMGRKNLESITVDLRCNQCDTNPARCARCQGIVDAAVAATRAQGVSDNLIQVRGGK
jgi:hypothetical protein